MYRSNFLDALDREIVESDGAATESDLNDVADLLSSQHLLPELAGVLSDPTQPQPARLRALSRAMSALLMAEDADNKVG